MPKTVVETNKRLVLLDSHAILHRAYHALPDFSTSKGEPTGALYGLSAMLLKIIEDLKPDYVVACYDVKGPTYRHEAYKDYKAGRKKSDDALVEQMISSRRIFEAFDIPIYQKEGFEADDMLGTIVQQINEPAWRSSFPDCEARRENPAAPKGLGDVGIDIVIASGDMDTLQLVDDKKVQVYTLKKGISDTIMYDEEAVMSRFGFGPKLIPDYKGLRGDPSDNIIGVKGIGDVTATTLIKTFGTIEDIYKELENGQDEPFLKAGIKPRIIQLLKDNKEEADFSKMLATIRRDAPIEFKFPDKTFKESLDVKKVEALWRDLEFRTLPQRLASLVSKWDSKQEVASLKEEKTLFSSISKEEVEKVGLALWLIRSDITNPKIEDILQFAGTDDFETAKAAIMSELKKKDLQKVYETIELPLIPITHSMEKRGVKIDRKILDDLGKTYHVELSRLEKEIWKLAGVEFNVNSPKQLGDILFDKLGLKGKNMKKTGGGARSTRESELEKLRDLHPIVPLLFEYRELAKLLSTYIDAIPPQLDADDRLHTDFIPSGTTTGRMASQNPNLQNIPIKSDLGKAIRAAFIAEKGFVLAGFDYSQMELRIAAFLSGDEKLIEIFKKGEDVHTSVASFVFKVSKEEVTPEMRRRAKVINFGIIYGMGVLALKQNLGTSREEAQNFLNDYFTTFSTLADYLNKVKAETARRGYTETFFGRRRYFEGITSRIPYIKASAERMAINAPIQGTEADIIKLAMIRIDEYIHVNKLEGDVFPLLQVHDELIYEIRESKSKEVAQEIEKIMESIIDPKETKGVVMKASAAMGKNWGELK
jgi:DNA polymerase-1